MYKYRPSKIDKTIFIIEQVELDELVNFDEGYDTLVIIKISLGSVLLKKSKEIIKKSKDYQLLFFFLYYFIFSN